LKRNLPSRLPELLTKAWTIHDQALNRKASPKIYSWHATAVACIAQAKCFDPKIMAQPFVFT
jgi:hypothetical protein